jgi:hypothetical protein
MSRTILRTERNLAHAMHELSGIKLDEDHPMQMVISEYRKDRTLAQNRLYWKWMGEISLGHMQATGEQHAPDVWAEYFKRQFLPVKFYTVRNIMIEKQPSTRELTTKEFSDYLERIDHFAADDLGIVLTHPQDIYAEAMGA